MKKPATELTRLKAKCLKKDGMPRRDAKAEDLLRLKQLQDAEPLTKAELEEAEKREAKQKEIDVLDYKARMAAKTTVDENRDIRMALHHGTTTDPELDKPKTTEHPRIATLKDALRVFTQLEVHPSRPDEFILIQRGVAVTAGDVRQAQKAMKI